MKMSHTTNIHEAGHGVMAILVGLVPRYITNIANATSAGRMYWGTEQRAPFRVAHAIATSDARARALIYAAGTAAVREILRDAAELHGADDTCIRTYARTIAEDETRVADKVVREAQTMFADEHVRNATIAIAARLERDRIVRGVDIERSLMDVGLTRVEPLPFRTAWQSSEQHGAVLGSTAFVDAASPHYFFTKRTP